MTLAEAIAHEEWAATTAHGELADEHAQMQDWLRELERLRTENAKLRELVEVGLRCCDFKCDGCKFLRLGLCHVGEFEDEARELGVEVSQ